ncbi:c6 transcription factor, partial [Colletotrichum incanum]
LSASPTTSSYRLNTYCIGLSPCHDREPLKDSTMSRSNHPTKKPTTAIPDQSPDVPRRNKPAFRISTPRDFDHDSRQNELKQRNGLSSISCQMCRLRKVKCELAVSLSESQASQDLHSPKPRCRACKQCNVECLWDMRDGRKRRKLQTIQQAGQKHRPKASKGIIPLDGSEEQPGLAHSTQTGAQPRETRSGRGRSQDQNPQSPGNQYAMTPSKIILLEDACDNDGNASECLKSHCDETQTPQDHIFEPFSNPGLQVPFDLFDVHDFFLDFETIGNSWDASPSNNHSIGSARITAPKQPKALRLRFYRRFGPTAVAPGLRRLSIAVRTNSDESLRLNHEIPPDNEISYGIQTTTSVYGTSVSQHSPYSDPEKFPYGIPFETVSRVLGVFFEHFRGHFPFLQPQILDAHVRSKQASSFLINAIIALTARFCPFDILTATNLSKQETEKSIGDVFLKRAKEQLVSLLGILAPDVVAGLLILAWAEFGNNNKAGLWMYSGMAIRMAQDLGFHQSSQNDIDPTVAFFDHAPLNPEGLGLLTDEQFALNQQKAKLLIFWSVFNMDVCVSLLMGRLPTLRRAEITAPLPTLFDMKVAQLDYQESESTINTLFPEIVQFMISFSEAVELLNRGEVPESTADSSQLHTKDGLGQIKIRLTRRYQSLNPKLQFSNENYKNFSSGGHAGLFLMLHLYFYTFMALLTKKSTYDGSRNMESMFLQESSDDDGPEAASLACQKIVQILNTAELINNHGYLYTPFINHCIFVAASIIGERSTCSNRSHSKPQNFMNLAGSSDFEYLRRKLREMEGYFKGIGATLAALERGQRDVEENHEGVDNFNANLDSEEDTDDVTELSDAGIINRYSIPRGAW